MVFNVTFNNFSVILWQSVLLVEETGVPGENHQSAPRIGNGYISLLYLNVFIILFTILYMYRGITIFFKSLL